MTVPPVAITLAALLWGAAPPAAASAEASAPLLVVPATPAPVAVPEVSAFTRHSRYLDVRLSPRGTWLAMISLEDGKRTLSFVRLADRSSPARLTSSPDTTVASIAWVNDERLVASLALADGTLAAPQLTGEILAVDPVGAVNKRIFGYKAGASSSEGHTRRRGTDLAMGFVLGRAPGDDRSILVTAHALRESGDRKARVIKLDVYNGQQTDVMLAPALNASFIQDERHEIRAAEGRDDQGRYHAFLRTEGGWTPLETLPGLTAGSELEGWRGTARTVLVSEQAGGGWGLWEVSLDDGARKRLATTRIGPPDRLLRDRRTGEVLAVESQPDLPDWQLVAPGHPLAQLLSGLLEAYPGQHVRLVSTTEDQRLAVAFVYGDRSPGQFLLVDVAARKAEPLLETRPWVKPEEAAEVAGFHIKARDGQPIHGYVTYPPGQAPGTKAPLVVVAHGGPHGVRDLWFYNPEVQLLASRGYAVLSVNYRGSGGYGWAYERAGYRHWGDLMMDDILDATRWLVGKGRVDGDRMCTFGGSFGGYSALQLVARAPDTFRCAIGFAGVYDLRMMEGNDEWADSDFVRSLMRTYLSSDQALLESFSPALHADRIKVPVFLIHGKKDVRVPIAHAEALRAALTAQGRPPEWLVEPNEGHGFYDEKARERMYRAVLAFLDRHTAARAAAPAAPVPVAPPAAPAAPPAPQK